MPDGALTGLNVLDFTHYVAGPYCTKLLADYGADVIKVEPPRSDGARRLGPFPQDVRHQEKSGLFLHLNTNKRGIVVDLKSDGAPDVIAPHGTMGRHCRRKFPAGRRRSPRDWIPATD